MVPVAAAAAAPPSGGTAHGQVTFPPMIMAMWEKINQKL